MGRKMKCRNNGEDAFESNAVRKFIGQGYGLWLQGVFFQPLRLEGLKSFVWEIMTKIIT